MSIISPFGLFIHPLSMTFIPIRVTEWGLDLIPVFCSKLWLFFFSSLWLLMKHFSSQQTFQHDWQMTNKPTIKIPFLFFHLIFDCMRGKRLRFLLDDLWFTCYHIFIFTCPFIIGQFVWRNSDTGAAHHTTGASAAWCSNAASFQSKSSSHDWCL